MTEPGTDPDALVRRLRAVERRLRREKATLERVNPIEDPERYTELFAGVIELEAARRDLRNAVGEPAGTADDGSPDVEDDPSDDPSDDPVDDAQDGVGNDDAEE